MLGCWLPNAIRWSDTSTEQNRRIISHIMEELAKGNGAPFVEAMADDMIHREMGVGNWSAVRRGKQAILETLYVPLRRRYDGPATNTATHISPMATTSSWKRSAPQR